MHVIQVDEGLHRAILQCFLTLELSSLGYLSLKSPGLVLKFILLLFGMLYPFLFLIFLVKNSLRSVHYYYVFIDHDPSKALFIPEISNTNKAGHIIHFCEDRSE